MKYLKGLVAVLFFVGSVLAAMWLTRYFNINHGESSRPTQPLSHVEHSEVLAKDFYTSQVRPIFNARCVACHSCYNSPCQLNLTTYSGVVRGLTKVDPYDFPLVDPRPPTRLDIDGKLEQNWRAMGFASVLSRGTVATASRVDSSLWQMISNRTASDSSTRAYNAETSRSCPFQGNELDKFISSKFFAAMPYGFPSLTSEQIETVGQWLDLGAPGPSLEVQKFMKEPQSAVSKYEIARWEKLLNQEAPAAALAARYFFEHLFIAHISFDQKSGEFFRLVRARNQNGGADEIATVRPFDDPGPIFYYRFMKIDSAIVAKTHTVFLMTEQVRLDFETDFLSGQWRARVKKLPSYGSSTANAFVTFRDIPRQIRYRFFLQHARYFIMNFIKGPVCRGQTALNVINEHFWVMFLDPKFDLSAQDTSPETTPDASSLESIEALLDPPATIANKMEVFSDIRERRWKANELKTQLYTRGRVRFSENAIWNGNGHNPNALLTVYRHFDSADVRWGAEGQNPKTVWVMDYQIFEDIYYNLVAGYNLFGTVLHQVDTRLYMDLSRIASEDMFINFLPQNQRMQVRKAWSSDGKATFKAKLATDILSLFGASAGSEMTHVYPYPGMAVETVFVDANEDSKGEFLKKLFADRLANQVRERPDLINLPNADREHAEPPPETAGVIMALRKISGRKSIFAIPFPDISLLRVRMNSGPDLVFSIVHNKEHANVNLVFFESLRREPENDTLNIVPGYAASYPNYYFDVKEDEIDAFASSVEELAKIPLTAEQLQLYEESKLVINPGFSAVARRFGVSRFDSGFWSAHDWFNEKFSELEPVEGGLLDLNRYESF